MKKKDMIKTENSSAQNDIFETQWQNRRQWERQVEKSVPEDDTFSKWMEKAQQVPVGSESDVSTFSFHRRRRWISYAAAASIVIAVVITGLIRPGHTDNGFPAAKEVIVESQTIHFLCNNGCSAQDIMILAGRVIK